MFGEKSWTHGLYHQLLSASAKVPAENLLYKVGKGATIAFNCLNIGRFKLGCSCLGGSKQAITTASQYALDRNNQ